VDTGACGPVRRRIRRLASLAPLCAVETVEIPGQLAQPGYADNLISEVARVMDLPRRLPALQGQFGNGPVTGLTDNDHCPTVPDGERAFYAPTGQPHNGPSHPPNTLAA
jgi:hypothetical protein